MEKVIIVLECSWGNMEVLEGMGWDYDKRGYGDGFHNGNGHGYDFSDWLDEGDGSGLGKKHETICLWDLRHE